MAMSGKETLAEQSGPEFGKEVLSGAIDQDYIDATVGVGIVISPGRLPCITPWAAFPSTPTGPF